LGGGLNSQRKTHPLCRGGRKGKKLEKRRNREKEDQGNSNPTLWGGALGDLQIKRLTTMRTRKKKRKGAEDHLKKGFLPLGNCVEMFGKVEHQKRFGGPQCH